MVLIVTQFVEVILSHQQRHFLALEIISHTVTEYSYVLLGSIDQILDGA